MSAIDKPLSHTNAQLCQEQTYPHTWGTGHRSMCLTWHSWGGIIGWLCKGVQMAFIWKPENSFPYLLCKCLRGFRSEEHKIQGSYTDFKRILLKLKTKWSRAVE